MYRKLGEMQILSAPCGVWGASPPVLNPVNTQTSEIQARQPILIAEQTRISARFRVISFLN